MPASSRLRARRRGPRPARRRIAASERGGSAGARAKRSAERRRAILAAARDEFAARGFAAARLDDVARRAGVAKGTIYLHFADKKALFQELVRFELTPLVTGLEQASQADMPLRQFAQQLLDVFVRDVLGTHRKDVIRLVLVEGQRFPELAEFYYREVVSRVLEAVRRLLRRAHARGELHDDALVRFPQLLAAPAILAIFWIGLFERFEPLDVRALLQQHFDMVLGSRRAE